jgi:hypothetical protein
LEHAQRIANHESPKTTNPDYSECTQQRDLG